MRLERCVWDAGDRGLLTPGLVSADGYHCRAWPLRRPAGKPTCGQGTKSLSSHLLPGLCTDQTQGEDGEPERPSTQLMKWASRLRAGGGGPGAGGQGEDPGPDPRVRWLGRQSDQTAGSCPHCLGPSKSRLALSFTWAPVSGGNCCPPRGSGGGPWGSGDKVPARCLAPPSAWAPRAPHPGWALLNGVRFKGQRKGGWMEEQQLPAP